MTKPQRHDLNINRARVSRLEKFANDIMTVSPNTILSNTQSIPNALVITHVGLGHILGIDDSDLFIPGHLEPSEVQQIISEVWRIGSYPPKYAVDLPATYSSLFVVARDTQAIDSQLLRTLCASQLNATLNQLTIADLTSEHPNPNWQQLRQEISKSYTEPDFNLTNDQLTTFENRIYAELVKSVIANNSEPLKLLSLLEITSIDWETFYPNSPDQDIEAWTQNRFIPKILPGSWASFPGSAVPNWVESMVVERGARFFPASSGMVPGWFFVAESNEECRAFNAWTYSPEVGFSEDSEAFYLSFPLRFEDNTHARVWYRYSRNDRLQLADLRALLAIGAVRIELYQIEPGGKLSHVQSFGIPLSARFIEQCNEAMETPSQTPGTTELDSLELTSDSYIYIMEMLDQSTSEFYRESITSLIRMDHDTGNALQSSFHALLRSIDTATASATAGSIIGSDDMDSAREQFLGELSKTPRNTHVDFKPNLLNHNEAYIQIRFDRESGYFDCFVFRVSDEGIHAFRIDISMGGSLLTSNAEFAVWVETSRQMLSPLSALIADGVDHLYLHIEPAFSHWPWHIPLTQIGFKAISYIPRLNSLSPTSVKLGRKPHALAKGFPGKGTNYLPYVSDELLSVTGMYSHDAGTNGQDRPDILHLSGHAIAGSGRDSVAIFCDEERPLSSAAVLLNAASFSSQLVVLSACNTGSIQVNLDSVPEVVSLETAFILSGAKVVISTCQPINDVIAFVFSVLFHDQLLNSRSAWLSFVNARDFLTGTDIPGADLLLSRWHKGWRADLDRALELCPHDWMKFRFAGRID